MIGSITPYAGISPPAAPALSMKHVVLTGLVMTVLANIQKVEAINADAYKECLKACTEQVTKIGVIVGGIAGCVIACLPVGLFLPK
jgi:hypothetical protein